ncbi:hypothetical protein [Brucella intermedia]|uniref:hypothetical protein n=1 Tax=Brucella intermedia TaxID=94625 RepID=UPI00235EAC4B|nr:hypothetical protein [Brucella intermedia]
MKNPVRNVVVEYKIKRARKGNVSLWGDIDLKTIAMEVAADTSEAPAAAAQAGSDGPQPPQNRAELDDTNLVKKIVPTVKTLENEREHSVLDAAEPEQAMIAPNTVQKPEIAERIIVRREDRFPRRGEGKGVLRKTKMATRPVAMIDMRAELLFLEQENASLKRELIAKLRAENENLFAMIKRAEKRTSPYGD